MEEETLEIFCKRHKIKCSSQRVAENPNMEPTWSANHYKCTLRAWGRQMTVPFSMGLGHTREPNALDVLYCLVSDASSLHNARDFEDWASEFGYDTDSRKAEKLYKTIKLQAKKLNKFLGEHCEEILG